MGGFAKISVGSVGSGAANASYITRQSAVGAPIGEEDQATCLHNAPSSVEAAESWEETRIRLRSWAEQTKAEERARHGNRTGQARTHYRMVLSYEETIGTEAAREDARDLLEEEFPKARAVGVVHQDTDHTHVHIWMSARKLDEKKVHIADQDLKGIHATFDRIYEERMNVRSRNAEKVEETRRFKRRYAELKAEGASPADLKKWAEANRPERADPPGPDVYRKRDRRRAVEEVAQAAETVEERRTKEIEDLANEIQKRIDQRGAYERNDRGFAGAEREAGKGHSPARPGERGDHGPSQSQSGEGGRGTDQGDGEGGQQDRDGSGPGEDRSGKSPDRSSGRTR